MGRSIEIAYDIPVSSGHIRIHADAADLLADFVYDEDVYRVKGDAGHHQARVFEESAFCLKPVFRPYGTDSSHILVAVFKYAKAKKHRAAVEDMAACTLQDAERVLDGSLVVQCGPHPFAQPDGEHLGQAAFNRGMKFCVRLYPIDDHNVVRLGCAPVHEDGYATIHCPDFDDILTGKHGHTHEELGNAEPG